MKRTFRILDVPWHLGHQYEMTKFPFAKFSFLKNFKRQYNTSVRNDFVLDNKCEWVVDYEKGKYDVAILHLDQQCFEEGIWDRGKGRVYRDLDEVIQDIPKIVIMHGTPYYPEAYPDPNVLIAKAKVALGNNTVVVNSHTAAKQWGFGKTIIHGLDPKEWWDLPKEPRVVTMISPAGLSEYYDRTFLNATKEALEDEGIQLCHITVDWSAKNWDEYRDFLGRSLVYFNPTRESPMPRARTEAMMSGCCVITTPHQDAANFIKHGENGFLCKRNPQDVVKQVLWCFDNYYKTVEIGQAGKQTAMKLFNQERYQEDWYRLLCEVVK
jgi:glycosyltransferase involved in cell wall biosynthesis